MDIQHITVTYDRKYGTISILAYDGERNYILQRASRQQVAELLPCLRQIPGRARVRPGVFQFEIFEWDKTDETDGKTGG